MNPTINMKYYERGMRIPLSKIYNLKLMVKFVSHPPPSSLLLFPQPQASPGRAGELYSWTEKQFCRLVKVNFWFYFTTSKTSLGFTEFGIVGL